MRNLAALSFAATLIAASALAADLPAGVTAPSAANVHAVGIEDYPEISRALHEEGVVTLSVLVGVDGHLSDAQIVKSSGYPRLDQSAQDTVVRDWLYKPATKDGQPIAVRIKVNVNYKMRPTSPGDLTAGTPFLIQMMHAADYPPESKAAGEEGVVGLYLVVDEKGEIASIKMVRQSAFPRLDQASMDIAKTKWKIKPAEVDGKPIKTVIAVIFMWSLKETDVKAN